MTEPLGRDVVVARTYNTTVEAELAASWLEASGVDCMVLADDAGGVYPNFQITFGVKLLVRAADEPRAKEVLEAAERASESDSGEG